MFFSRRHFIAAGELATSLCGWEVLIQNEFAKNPPLKKKTPSECDKVLYKNFNYNVKYIRVNKWDGPQRPRGFAQAMRQIQNVGENWPDNFEHLTV
jgi:hypothetical protein